MAVEPTTDTQLLRLAIEQALTETATMMTSYDLARHPAVAAFSVDTEKVAKVLSSWVPRPSCPVKRVRNPEGSTSKYLYYLSGLVDPYQVLGRRDNTKPQDAMAAPVNTVNPPSFEFNPIELGEQHVTLPSAKRITLEVGGVKISIELGQ